MSKLKLDDIKNFLLIGIKTGNLDIVFTVFNLLSSDRVYWNWLKSHLLLVVQETCWYMVGELSEFLSSNPVDPQLYKKFLYKLTLVDKSIEISSLYQLVKFKKFSSSHVEYKQVMDLFKNNFHTITDILLCDNIDASELSQYEYNASVILYKNLLDSGLVYNKILSLINIVLINNRGIDKVRIKEHIKYALMRYKKKNSSKPKKVNLKIIKANLEIPSYMINNTDGIIPNPDCFQIMWGSININE